MAVKLFFGEKSMQGNDCYITVAPASWRVSNTVFRLLQHNWRHFDKRLVGSGKPSAMRTLFFTLLDITSCGFLVLNETYFQVRLL